MVPVSLIVLELVLNGWVFAFLMIMILVTSPLWFPLILIWWPVLIIVKLLLKYTSIWSYVRPLVIEQAYYLLYNY